MGLKEAFQEALDFEQKGRAIYEETSKKTKNPVVAKTFSYLSEQELLHINEIKGYLEKLDDGNKVELKGDTLEDTKRFFNTTVKQFKEKAELSDDDVKAHETALELEQRSYGFYRGQYEQSGDEQLKRFFRWLMQQENAHYELIQKAYSYIKDPVGFYAEEEKWIADGG